MVVNTKKAKRFVAYYRVSTDKQGKSGLGLEAQQQAVESFVRSEQGELMKAFVEIETGKSKDRPELAKAIAHAKRSKATLIVAKLDRLARNVAFTSALMESGVDFVACDNPHANRLTIHILAAVAENEAEMISARTKAALEAFKARGGLLGSCRPECANNLSDEAQEKGRQVSAVVRTAKARTAYAELLPVMNELRQQGKTYREIAAHLNTEGYTTARGNAWSHVQARLVMERGE